MSEGVVRWLEISDEEFKERIKALTEKKHKADCRAYYQKHKEKFRAYRQTPKYQAARRAYYHKHRERELARMRAWRKKNPDYHKEYYQKNRDRLNAYRRAYRAKKKAEKLKNTGACG